MHSPVAIVLFALFFTAVPMGAGEWLGRRARHATRPSEWHTAAGGLPGALMAVFHAAQDTVALCRRCHLDEDAVCVCLARRQRLASALTAAEEALRYRPDERVGTASGVAPKTRR